MLTTHNVSVQNLATDSVRLWVGRSLSIQRPGSDSAHLALASNVAIEF